MASAGGEVNSRGSDSNMTSSKNAFADKMSSRGSKNTGVGVTKKPIRAPTLK